MQVVLKDYEKNLFKPEYFQPDKSVKHGYSL